MHIEKITKSSDIDLSTEHFQDGLFDMPENFLKEYEYQILDESETRYNYVKNTERLIANVISDKDDYVVFLDKSARPVAWLMKSLWPILGVDDKGEHVPMPAIKFANIDREQWQLIMGRSADKDSGGGISAVPQSNIDDLHDTFTSAQIIPGVKPIDRARVRIVDEVMASGDTIRMAMGLFQRALPDADITSSYWMVPETKRTGRGGAVVNADLPVWYREDRVDGRLVGNRSSKASEKSPSSAQRHGALFLSTRFNSVDQKGVQLKHEMQQLAEEVQNGAIPVVPHAERDIDVQEMLIHELDRLSTEEFIALKKESQNTGETFLKVYKSYKMARLESARYAHPASKR